jgi:hypothetical protein
MSMNEPDDTGAQRGNDTETGDSGAGTGGEPELSAGLSCTLVRYDGEPDRVTVYPADASGVERMATWLTADADACHDVDEMR